jgi:hypothetical protein
MSGHRSADAGPAELRREGPKAAELERELNERVFRLFGLTGEEVAVVEAKTRG